MAMKCFKSYSLYQKQNNFSCWKASSKRPSLFPFKHDHEHSSKSIECKSIVTSQFLASNVSVICSNDNSNEIQNVDPKHIKIGAKSRNDFQHKAKRRFTWSRQSPIHEMKKTSGEETRSKSRTNTQTKSNQVNSDLEFEHVISLDVNAPADFIWELWLDLPRTPEWMRWIERVEILKIDEKNNDKDKEDEILKENEFNPAPAPIPPSASASPSPSPSHVHSLSRWVCSTTGFEVSWIAQIERIERVENCRTLYWKTVEGFSSRGKVSFTQNEKNTTINLAICHSLPPLLAKIMNKHALSSVIEATLKCDLQKFQQIAEETYPQSESFT